jgi:hypothetical protein
MQHRPFDVAVCVLLLGPLAAAAQQAPRDYRAAVAALGRRVIETSQGTIARMDMGRLALDTNRFTARVTNSGDSPRLVDLDIRTMPGLWLPANWQRSYRFEVPARGERLIDVPYVFRRMTPEATLRIAFGTPRASGGGADAVERFYDTTLAVGARNPAATDPRPAFDTLSTGHFDVLAWRGSAGDRKMATVAADREQALTRIAAVLDVPFTGRILLVLYPDSATKTSQTGHRGDGFASGRTIIEIFNDSVQLDPYHELAHIVGGERGSPPAMLDEGFAVYISESLGADALKYLDAPGRTVMQVACGHVRSGASIPLARLSRFTDIGSDSTSPAIAYPESASVTAFLIERYGIARFRDAYSRLRSTTDAAELRQNERIIEEIYGRGIVAIEAAWREWLRCGP